MGERFNKKFVTQCSDGELIADFKNGKEVKVSSIRAFIRSESALAVKEALEKRTKLIVKELEFFQEHHTLTRSMGNIIEYIASLDKPYEGMIVDTDPEEHNV